MFLHVCERHLSGIHGESRAHLARQFQSKGVQVGDHHMPRTRVFYNRNRHEPDRSRARNQHVFAQNRKGKRCVDCIAEGIEDRGNFFRNAGAVFPDVGHGQRNQLGKCSPAG